VPPKQLALNVLLAKGNFALKAMTSNFECYRMDSCHETARETCELLWSANVQLKTYGSSTNSIKQTISRSGVDYCQKVIFVGRAD